MMSQEIGKKVEQLSDTLGVSVELPNVTKNGQKTSGIITTTIGTGSLVAGLILKNKLSIITGAVAICCGIASYIDAANCKEK